MEKINNCSRQICKAIPLAYDESLSYYEDICKIKKTLNEIISFANNELTQQLREYINQEFNNMIINTMYNAETETLTLYLERSVNNG